MATLRNLSAETVTPMAIQAGSSQPQTESRVKLADGPGGRQICLLGECDVRLAAELASLVRREVDSGAPRLIFNLTQATFLDSRVLGALLGARRRLRERHAGADVVLLCRPGFISRLLRLLAMEQIFKIMTPEEWDEYLARVH